jgi:nitroreductase
MDFMGLALARRSLRSYSPEAVSRAELELLAEALRLAPSASNQQPWKLVFVDEPELKDEVARACFGPTSSFNRFAVQAPVLAVICQERPRLLNRIGTLAKRRDWTLLDIGIAAEHLCLRAVELGLGTCMMGWFDEGRIRLLLRIPASSRVGLVVSIGRPAEADPGRPKVRKPLESILGYNRY